MTFHRSNYLDFSIHSLQWRRFCEKQVDGKLHWDWRWSKFRQSLNLIWCHRRCIWWCLIPDPISLILLFSLSSSLPSLWSILTLSYESYILMIANPCSNSATTLEKKLELKREADFFCFASFWLMCQLIFRSASV